MLWQPTALRWATEKATMNAVRRTLSCWAGIALASMACTDGAPPTAEQPDSPATEAPRDPESPPPRSTPRPVPGAGVDVDRDDDGVSEGAPTPVGGVMPGAPPP